jgi:hypothetical protein
MNRWEVKFADWNLKKMVADMQGNMVFAKALITVHYLPAAHVQTWSQKAMFDALEKLKKEQNEAAEGKRQHGS